jgi:DNA-binding protein WhiA
LSFSGDIRRELMRQIGTARSVRLAELAAFVLLCGSVRCSKRETFVTIDTGSLTVADKSFILLNKAFNITPLVRVSSFSTGRDKSFHIVVDGREAEELVEALKLNGNHYDSEGMCTEYKGTRYLLEDNECKRAFLRGTFMAAGSVTDPEKEYHLEMTVKDLAYVSLVSDAMGAFGQKTKSIERKGSRVIYIKDGEDISDFLNVIQAYKAMYTFENVRILKGIRNSVNRQVNCETANIDKTVNAAVKQLEDIRYIEKKTGFLGLKDSLRETAELRLKYPDASLRELADISEGKLTRSGINHRLKKLSEIADKLRR